MSDKQERFHFARLTPAEYQDETEQVRLPFEDHGSEAKQRLQGLTDMIVSNASMAR